MDRARLLIVDDEPSVARAIGRLLSLEYQVTLVYSAAEALERLTAGERFAAILSDVGMPALDGMGLYDRIAELAPDQCQGFIFLTGGHFSPRLQRFVARHHTPWLEKPFLADQLKSLLRARVLPAAPL